jgi:hypothetical protein
MEPPSPVGELGLHGFDELQPTVDENVGRVRERASRPCEALSPYMRGSRKVSSRKRRSDASERSALLDRLIEKRVVKG